MWKYMFQKIAAMSEITNIFLTWFFKSIFNRNPYSYTNSITGWHIFSSVDTVSIRLSPVWIHRCHGQCHRKSREFEPVCSKLSSIFVVVKYRLNLKLFQHGVKSSFINAFTFEIYTVTIKIIKPADLENHYLFWEKFWHWNFATFSILRLVGPGRNKSRTDCPVN